MASIVSDSFGSHDASRPPISLHPAFPAVVALWFAALLGIGSMILPVVLIERIVELTGLSTVLPAASPPLGFMARGLIALASALAGAAIGVAIARRVASAHDAERPSRASKFARRARRPIDINEEIGGEGLVNGLGLPVSRRRALAIAEDDRPSDFLYMAPLPGHDGDEALAFDERHPSPRAADEPFELSNAFEELADDAEPQACAATDADFNEEPLMTFKQEFQPLTPDTGAEPRQEFVPERAEPLPFSAPSLARRSPETEGTARDASPAPIPREYEPEQPEPELDEAAASAPEPEPEPFRGDWSSAPLGELGLVQLVQRLGASLERRREWLASTAAAPAPAPLLAPAAGFEPAPAQEAVEAMAAYFGRPAEIAAGDAAAEAVEDARDDPQPVSASFAPPALTASWSLGDDDDDGDAMPSFTLPLRKTVAPTIAFDHHDTPENDDDIAGDESDDSYSSLLAIRNPFAPKDSGFVRIDEPEEEADVVQPAVVFPGTGQADSSAARAFDPPTDRSRAPAALPNPPATETDAALRTALATLQRMSGTA